MNKNDLPELTQQPIKYVDATPDDLYALRILRAYRNDCDCKWVSNEPNALIDMMNNHQDQRAIILDKAIKILEERLSSDVERL